MKLHPRVTAVAATALATTVVAIACVVDAAHAAPEREPGTLLREGTWGDGVGAYELPASLRALPPRSWPRDGWVRVTHEQHGLRSERVAGDGAQPPAFLAKIAAQIDRPAPDTLVEAPADRFYLHVPGVAFREGAITTYRFQNGTSRLTPKLDVRYELVLDGQPFAFTVQNGLRTAGGAPYGSGALYTIEYDGEVHEYLVGEFGWDSGIEAIADLDGDGKPDFVLHVGGNNSATEAVLLSSKAHPGRNAPTATLVSGGC